MKQMNKKIEKCKHKIIIIQPSKLIKHTNINMNVYTILHLVHQILFPPCKYICAFWGKKYVYKIYLCACPIELAHSKEITISFEQKPVTVAIIWKENLFQFYIIWCFKGNLCLGITMTIVSILNIIILIQLLNIPN